mgnify:CR=1 FL=1
MDACTEESTRRPTRSRVLDVLGCEKKAANGKEVNDEPGRPSTTTPVTDEANDRNSKGVRHGTADEKRKTPLSSDP